MLTPRELMGIKTFQPNEKVFVMSKGYPVACEVIERREKNNITGYYLQILDEGIIQELGADKLWLPAKAIDELVEA